VVGLRRLDSCRDREFRCFVPHMAVDARTAKVLVLASIAPHARVNSLIDAVSRALSYLPATPLFGDCATFARDGREVGPLT
jgi:hypothetical protein